MSEGFKGYYLGFIAASLTCVTIYFLLGLELGHQEALDNCAKSNNVYQCEMVAVPKTGEK